MSRSTNKSRSKNKRQRQQPPIDLRQQPRLDHERLQAVITNSIDTGVFDLKIQGECLNFLAMLALRVDSDLTISHQRRTAIVIALRDLSVAIRGFEAFTLQNRRDEVLEVFKDVCKRYKP